MISPKTEENLIGKSFSPEEISEITTILQSAFDKGQINHFIDSGVFTREHFNQIKNASCCSRKEKIKDIIKILETKNSLQTSSQEKNKDILYPDQLISREIVEETYQNISNIYSQLSLYEQDFIKTFLEKGDYGSFEKGIFKRNEKFANEQEILDALTNQKSEITKEDFVSILRKKQATEYLQKQNQIEGDIPLHLQDTQAQLLSTPDLSEFQKLLFNNTLVLQAAYDFVEESTKDILDPQEKNIRRLSLLTFVADPRYEEVLALQMNNKESGKTNLTPEYLVGNMRYRSKVFAFKDNLANISGSALEKQENIARVDIAIDFLRQKSGLINKEGANAGAQIRTLLSSPVSSLVLQGQTYEEVMSHTTVIGFLSEVILKDIVDTFNDPNRTKEEILSEKKQKEKNILQHTISSFQIYMFAIYGKDSKQAKQLTFNGSEDQELWSIMDMFIQSKNGASPEITDINREFAQKWENKTTSFNKWCNGC